MATQPQYDRRTARQVRDELKRLKATTGWPLSKIAQKPPWRPIPAGTLSDIINDKPIPKKWRKHLGISYGPPRIAVRKDDPQSAAQSLLNNIEPDVLYDIVEYIRREMT